MSRMKSNGSEIYGRSLTVSCANEREKFFKHFSSARKENLKITRSGAVFSPQSRSLTKDFREYTKDDFSELQLIYFAGL
jgi:hypothetical protein